MDLSEKLQGQLANLPAQPGCYLMKDAGGVVIYVGKAINLRNRVRSYFHASSDHSGKTRELVRRVVKVKRSSRWTVVSRASGSTNCVPISKT